MTEEDIKFLEQMEKMLSESTVKVIKKDSPIDYECELPEDMELQSLLNDQSVLYSYSGDSYDGYVAAVDIFEQIKKKEECDLLLIEVEDGSDQYHLLLVFSDIFFRAKKGEEHGI